MSEQDTNLGRVEGRLSGIETELAKLNKMLWGNGQPGLAERTIRIEENMEKLTQISEDNNQAIKDLSKAVGELKALFEQHINDEEKHTLKGMFLKKDIIAVTLLVVVIVHSILPEGIDVWGLVSKFFGI